MSSVHMPRLHRFSCAYVPVRHLHLAEANPTPDPGPWQMLEEVLASFRSKQVLSSIDFERLSADVKAIAVRFAGVWNTRFADALYRSIEDSIGEGISPSDWLTEASSLIKQYGGSTALGIYAPDLTGDSMSSWYACLLPGTVVEGDVVAASKARYQGPAVEIETDDGRRLRATVNHPVLTPAGWKSAGDVHEGDDLLCYGAPVKLLHDREADFVPSRDLSFSKRRAVNDQHAPASVEDVFESLLRERPTWLDVERPVRPLDFHGDAAFFDGKVRVVRPDRVLPQVTNAQAREMFGQRRLMHRYFPGPGSALPSGGDPALDFHRHGAAAMRLMHRFKRQNPLLSPSRSEPVPGCSLRFGAASHLDPARFQATEKRSGGDVHLAADLLATLSGSVAVRRVAKVQRIEWTGHIFDLQTRTGLIVADGIITSNSLVFRQNTMNALNAARYAESFFGPALESDAYWMFATAEDERVCEICSPLDGMVFSKIDAEGRKYLPSVHLNCRCEEIDLSADDVRAGGYSISSGHGVGIVLPGDFNVDRLISVPEELRRAA